MTYAPTPKEINEIAERTNAAAAASGLPGWINGPADTLRHLIVAGELRRLYGPVVARAYLDGNEVRAALFDKNVTRARTMMDHRNNSEGMALGKGAASFDEVVERAERRTLDAIESNGRGPKSPRYLDRRHWQVRPGVPDTADIPPEFAERVRARGDKTGKRAAIDAILARPSDEWSEAEARKVMQDPRYWKKQDPAVTAPVAAFFDKRYPGTTDGPVQVDSYTRGDGTHVAAHTRASPRGHRT
jgi:hypothetical protein